MTVRSLGLVSLLAALAVGGWLFFAQAREAGPTSDVAERAQADANANVAATNFQSAVPLLQAHHAQAGTYTGAVLPPNLGVTLVRADTTSYCLQAGAGAAVQHVVGPGGSPASGPCPPA
jgi:hypothetical protein